MVSSHRRQRPAATTRTRSSRPFIPILVIVVAGASTYWNSLGGSFVWDDQTSIVTNPTILHLWPLSDPLRPPRETPVAGRPLVNLSFAVNYALGGLAETGYHVGNVSIHVACAMLLFGFVRRTLARPRTGVGGKPGEDEARARLTALVAALLWMLHPLQSEAVDYITQRSESLMALFFLLTLYCAQRAHRSAYAGRWQTLSVLSCACGMASKESMVTAPLAVLLYDRVFEFNSLGQAVRSRTRLYAGLAATWIEVAAFLWQQPRSTAGLSAAIDPWTYLLNQVQMIGRYLRLSLWPRALVLDYGLPRPLSIGDVTPDALIIVPLVVATGIALVRWPAVGFLGATFFLTLAPTSSLIPIVSEVGAERRMYLPFAALAVLVTMAGRAVVDRVSRDPAKRQPALIAATGLTVVVLAALAVRTVYRNQEYTTPLTLWRTVVNRRPHGRARMSLAIELIAAGDHRDAMVNLREAVHDFPDARAALGTELVLEGNIAEGTEQLRQFIRDQPSHPNRIPARSLLGTALTSQGKLGEAADEFRSILKLSPSNADARTHLADVLFAQKRYDEAAVEYRVLIADQPNNPVIEIRLGSDLMAGGRLQEAAEHFEKALQLDPRSAAAHRDAAEAYLRQGHAEQGTFHAREAVGLEPGNPAAHNLLGVAMGSTGRLDEAIAQFRLALQLSPNDQPTRDNLDRALRIAKAR